MRALLRHCFAHNAMLGILCWKILNGQWRMSTEPEFRKNRGENGGKKIFYLYLVSQHQ